MEMYTVLRKIFMKSDGFGELKIGGLGVVCRKRRTKMAYWRRITRINGRLAALYQIEIVTLGHRCVGMLVHILSRFCSLFERCSFTLFSYLF